MANPIILAYNLDMETENQMKLLCEKLGFAYRAVTPELYALPIGALAGIPISGKPAVSLDMGFSEPMLVMCHLLNPQLDAFLKVMRTSDIPRIDLKAILTPSNVTWNSRQLRDELAREHESVRATARKG